MLEPHGLIVSKGASSNSRISHNNQQPFRLHQDASRNDIGFVDDGSKNECCHRQLEVLALNRVGGCLVSVAGFWI